MESRKSAKQRKTAKRKAADRGSEAADGSNASNASNASSASNAETAEPTEDKRREESASTSEVGNVTAVNPIEPMFVSVRGSPVALADTVIVYESGTPFPQNLVVDSSGRLLVTDAVYNVKSDGQRYADASAQAEETDQDCFEVDSAGRRLQPQQQIVQQQHHHHQQHQPPQQIHIQHQPQPQMMQGDYEIVQFVQANPNAAVANATADPAQESQDSDGVSESKACWLNTKYDFVVRKLQLDYDAGVKLLHSPKGVLKCVYFTTPAMQQAFNAVPQFLCIETDLCFRSAVVGLSVQVKQTVTLILAEDGNGKSIIVSVGVSTVGDNIRWLLDTFKSCNPAWRQVRCVVAEPGHNTEAIKSSFSGAHVCCNAWQAARWASRYAVPPASVQTLRPYVEALLKGDEVDHIKMRRLVGGATLNRLPRLLDKDNLTNYIHNGLEKVLRRFEPLESTPGLQPEEFVTFFFDVVRLMEEERRTIAINRLQETINLKQSPTDTLTQYAYFLIHQQTQLAQQSIDQQQNSKDTNDYLNTYATSTQECLCPFGRVFRLPCRHILMLTSELKVKSHIPFELRWTVFHCLFGCEMETTTIDQASKQQTSTSEASDSGQLDQQHIKQEYIMTQREGQVIFCTPSSGAFSTNENVQFIKSEPTTQPA